jgi:hypothetical protein
MKLDKFISEWQIKENGPLSQKGIDFLEEIAKGRSLARISRMTGPIVSAYTLSRIMKKQANITSLKFYHIVNNLKKAIEQEQDFRKSA